MSEERGEVQKKKGSNKSEQGQSPVSYNLGRYESFPLRKETSGKGVSVMKSSWSPLSLVTKVPRFEFLKKRRCVNILTIKVELIGSLTLP